jgi:hypothetical protein
LIYFPRATGDESVDHVTVGLGARLGSLKIDAAYDGSAHDRTAALAVSNVF